MAARPVAAHAGVMPKSRKRRPKPSGRTRPSSHAFSDRSAELEELRPWLDTMFAADDAERRGQAMEALSLVESRPFDPDGKPFWRPWRISRLLQVVLLGPQLPPWAVSRWIAAQAHETYGGPGDRRRRRCGELALEIRGGTDGLSIHGETDAMCKLMDHDWVYRQLFLYELGGLSAFLRQVAPHLLARADHIHEWCRAPMTALRLVQRSARTVTWERLGDGQRLELDNIGSAALVVPGEHVLGRLVPIDGGTMLDASPLVVSLDVADRVAAEPGSWWRALMGRTDIKTGGYEFGMVNDVRDVIWEMALLASGDAVPEADELDAYLARRTLEHARNCLSEARPWGDDAVDPWACLRAAVLSPAVAAGLPEVVGPADLEVFEALAPLLAAPADLVCRNLAAELRSAA